MSQSLNNATFLVYRRSKGFAPFVAEMLAKVQPKKQGITIHIAPDTGHFDYHFDHALKMIPMGVPKTASEASTKAKDFRAVCKTKLQTLCGKQQLPSLLPDYLQPDGQPQPVYADFGGQNMLHYWEVRYVPQLRFGERQKPPLSFGEAGWGGSLLREPINGTLTSEALTVRIGINGLVVGISSNHTPFELKPEPKPVFRLAPLPTVPENAQPFMPSLKARAIGERVAPFYVFEDGTEKCAVEGVSEKEGVVKNNVSSNNNYDPIGSTIYFIFVSNLRFAKKISRKKN